MYIQINSIRNVIHLVNESVSFRFWITLSYKRWKFNNYVIGIERSVQDRHRQWTSCPLCRFSVLFCIHRLYRNLISLSFTYLSFLSILPCFNRSNPFAPHSSRIKKIIFKFEFVNLEFGFFYFIFIYIFFFRLNKSFFFHNGSKYLSMGSRVSLLKPICGAQFCKM